MTLSAGTHLGPYEILSPLGAGGMGEVYRARDTRLEREVAVKVLPEHLASDRGARARLERESRAVAALSHPNILAIHDVGSEGDTSFVVMELLEGETLRERVRRSPIPWRKAVEYGIAIADGLAAAHAKGVVHRDLKPENIFLTSDGVLKILDFGLAAVESAGAAPEDKRDTPTMTLVTKPGTVLGTVSYMSPEQIRGQKTDARSDIFSFGCVLYEMITGHRAFSGETSADTMTAILKQDPPSVVMSLGEVGPELDRTIIRCLEKNPRQRFQSSSDLSFTLRAVLSDSHHSTPLGALKWGRVKLSRVLAIAVVVIVGAFFALRETGVWRGAQEPAIDSLAVLPFANVSGDPNTAYLADEIPANIIVNLSKLSKLRVVPRESVYHYMDQGGDAFTLARKLNVSVVLTGRINVRGDDLTIYAELVDVAKDRQLWGERYVRKLADILATEEDIVRDISEAMRLRLTSEDQVRLAKRPTENAEAHFAYLQGRHFWSKETAEGCRKAIEYFKQAIEIDRDYALAYTGLADAYNELGAWAFIPAYQALAEAKEAARRALEIDDTRVEAHVSMAFLQMFFEWDYAAAEESLERALELDPRYGFAHHVYGHLLAILRRDDEALAEFEEALNIDPLSPHHMTCLCIQHLHMGRYDEAERWARKAVEIDPHSGAGHHRLGWTYVRRGMLEQAIGEFRKCHPQCEADLAHALGLAGEESEARTILDRWLGESRRGWVPAVEVANILVGLGEVDQALDWLEKAFETRDSGWLAVIATEAPFESLFGNPRFNDLLLRMGQEPIEPVSLPRHSRKAEGEP